MSFTMFEPVLSGLPQCSTTPTLLLLCGYPDTADGWSPIARHFEKTHHIVSINLPDYEKDRLTKRWGHSINDIVNGLHQFLLSYQGSDIYLVGHDWGSLICQFYAERFPRSIVKLVLLDIGKSERGGAMDLFAYKKPISGIILTSYVYYVAFCFIISRLSESLALYLISIYPWETIGPMNKSDSKIMRAPPKAFMVYPYFQAIALLFRNPRMLQPRAYEVPGVPQLFMFGRQKRFMYHDESFLEFLASSKGSGYREFPAGGHWFQLSSPSEVADEMKDFFEKDDYVSKAPNETLKETSEPTTKDD